MNRFYAFLRLTAITLFFVGFFAFSAKAQRPTTFDFGQVPCGTTVCDTVWIPALTPGEGIVEVGLRDSTRIVLEDVLRFPMEIATDDSVGIPLCFTAAKRGSVIEDSLRVVVRDAFDNLETAWVKIIGVGIGPLIEVDIDQYEFPVTAVGAVGAGQIEIHNRGEEDFLLTADKLVGIDPPFKIITALPLNIPADSSVLIDLEFEPDSSRVFLTVLEIIGACGETDRVQLSGRTPDIPDFLSEGYGEVPCGSEVCDTLWVKGENDGDAVVNVTLRDNVSYSVGDGFTTPALIPIGDSVGIPICFSPSRRGTIVDSVTVDVQRNGASETIKVRLTGIGVGPAMDVDPIVLNFPKTSPPASSQLSTFFENNGERPFVLTEDDLPIPPPFRLLTQLPREIKPGERLEIQVEFVPTETGIFSVPVNVTVGCNRILQIGLNGSTDFIGTGGVLRVSKIGFNPANDERVACDVSQCTEVTLSNVGNASLRVDDIDWANGSLGYFFSVPPATPLFIEPNESITIEVCINATRAGTLEDTLLISSNDRRSIAFGILVDASNSMEDSLDCGVGNTPMRLEEAIKQAQTFIDNTLLYLPALNIQDQIAVKHYSSMRQGFNVVPVVVEDFPLTSVTNPTRAAARASVSSIALIGGTWTGHAIRDMIRTVSASPLEDRVIVVLTDGVTNDDDLDANPVSSIINDANANNVRVFTIGLQLTDPDGINYLDAIATGTNGISIISNDCGSLQDAFAQITEIVSQGSTWREPFKITVSAPQIIADNIDFDSLLIFNDTCVSITLTNVGEGEAIVDTVEFTDLAGGQTTEFFLESTSVSFPITIQENEQKTFEVCFRPEELRTREGLTIVTYNDCNAEPGSGALVGVGVAQANLRVTDQRMALPGQTVTMPIYGDTSLRDYSVNSIIWTVRWNRTMLELEAVRPGAEANGATVIQTSPILYDGRFASVDLTATGPALFNAGQLAELDFTFLRGDSLVALVEITAGQFEDGNPKAVLQNAGVVIYDSTCFRELRPIIYKGPPAKITIGNVSPVPATGDLIDVSLEATNETAITLDMYDASGATVILPERHQLLKGSSVLSLDVGTFRSGVYHLRIQTDDGETLFHKLIIRR